MTSVEIYQSYHIGTDLCLTDGQKHSVVAALPQQPAPSPRSLLGGRNAVARLDLAGIGRVVIKHYARGGFIRKLLRQTYLKITHTRCWSEYDLLQYLRKIGVKVPEPVAFVYKGELFYQAWLITREIANSMTLAELSLTEPDRVPMLLPAVKQQIEILIKHHIHHVDLHPGNVLVGPASQVFLIDFDKARIRQANKPRLRQQYVQRWQRAVAKHQLPAVLNDLGI